VGGGDCERDTIDAALINETREAIKIGVNIVVIHDRPWCSHPGE
jgi:hypothetical protein